jgi:glutamine amidotransferase
MIVVIDYGVGNLGSILNMLRRIGASAIVSSNPEEIARAEKLILPGVGSFDNGMMNLRSSGLLPAITQKVMESETPILGICLGMQLLTKSSEEGVSPGLGWIDAATVRFSFGNGQSLLKIPHMGWNTIKTNRPSALFDGFTESARFYFVHSFHVVCKNQEDVLATTVHGYDFASAFRRRNIFGTQFHPEKSHKFGIKLLKNFIEAC